MFNINLDNAINSDLPVITDNYQILHFDEYPILFTGTNKYGNKLLGSFVNEDEDNDLFRYFIIILDNEQFSNYFNKLVSYRDLILSVKEVFVVDRDINDNVVKKYLVPLNSIPQDYLPLSSSFIPDAYTISNALKFSFSLKGKLADLHKGFVNDINNINLKIYNYLQESLNALTMFQVSPKIYSQPSQQGSYRLNFDVEFKHEQQMSLFKIDELKVAEFFNGYLNYIAYSFPNEEDGFLDNEPENSEQFLSLKHNFEDILLKSNIAPLSTVSDILIDSINSSAERLSDVTEYLKINNSFDSIEVGRVNDNGDFSTIGYLLSDYKDVIQSKLLIEEESLTDDEIISDETPQHYRILVYRINSETGKGGARLYFDETEDYYKILLNIHKNDSDLSNSIFTKSLNENKVVDVNGIGTMINGTYHKLDCYL